MWGKIVRICIYLAIFLKFAFYNAWFNFILYNCYNLYISILLPNILLFFYHSFDHLFTSVSGQSSCNSLADWDEAWYADASRYMFNNQHYLTFRSGIIIIFFDKPPLQYC